MDHPFMISKQIPECALRMLARNEWFSELGMFQRATLKPANHLARFVSNPIFSKRSDIAATTLGHSIYFLATRYYDPHSAAGLSLLAHEFKHVEQIERSGIVRFYGGYLLEYLHSGYGEEMSQEAEAYELGRIVYAHIKAEITANAGRSCCLGSEEQHRVNPDFILIKPANFRTR
jgi:hypothetical protein